MHFNYRNHKYSFTSLNLFRGGCIVLAVFFVTLSFQGVLYAQDDKPVIAHNDIFGQLQRPPAAFSHDLHMEAFYDQGCGVCHHVYDNSAGKLVYNEGEEYACIDCHEKKADSNVPALREAFHGSCTACHRNMIKKKIITGPTTCGECHPKH